MTDRTGRISLRRDCDAARVPHGDRVRLPAGAEVEVVQRLGSSITVRTDRGTLARIDGSDSDALGLRAIRETNVRVATNQGAFDPEAVISALRTVYDPEIPVNIIDLGLVYRCEDVPLDGGGHRVEIDMTMTAPGCGMGDVLQADALRAVRSLPGVDEVDVSVVWDPPWTRDRISEAARLELGLF